MRAAWLTDIHLNFLSPVGIEKFFTLVRSCEAEVFFITGDIGEAPRLGWYLKRLEEQLQRPIYFVLGNHDYYHSSIDETRAAARKVVSGSSRLIWMNELEVVQLTPHTALIGHDSWADGRCGDYVRSDVTLNDYVLIGELSSLSKNELLFRLNRLGDEAAAHFKRVLPQVAARFQQVFMLTHVPPFREACWHMGAVSDDHYLPHFACQAVGDVLQQIMQAHPACQLTVLCGHTHSSGIAHVLPNLKVLTGQADYGVPQIQQVFEIA